MNFITITITVIKPKQEGYVFGHNFNFFSYLLANIWQEFFPFIIVFIKFLALCCYSVHLTL